MNISEQTTIEFKTLLKVSMAYLSFQAWVKKCDSAKKEKNVAHQQARR